MTEKKDVSLNDLEKDLDKGNERVLDYLNEQAVKQGYFNPDDPTVDSKLQEQNDPKKVEIKDHSANLSALEVAREATKDQEKQDKAREARLKKAADEAKK
jgi:hypothetical protein